MNNQSNSLSSENTSKMMVLSKEIEALETKLKEYDELKKSYDDFKKELYGLMLDVGMKKFTSQNNTQFTTVAESLDKIEIVLGFNEEKFKKEQPKLYNDYIEQKEKFTKGRAGYLRITLPKEKEELEEI